MLIDAISGYHNLKLDEKSSHLMTFSCLFGRYQYIRLSFGAILAGHMFQSKIDKLFSDMPNVFGIADDILIAGFDSHSRHHEVNVEQILQRCRQANLKLNKEKCLLR